MTGQPDFMPHDASRMPCPTSSTGGSIPKDKSLGNRQRFLRRARAQIKEVVNQSFKDRSITDVDGGQTISIPTKGIGEPRFHHATEAAAGASRSSPATRSSSPATRSKSPRAAAGEGGGKQASDSGEGEDEFQFALSREEFLDLFFEDLELPDLVKTSLKEGQVLQAAARRLCGDRHRHQHQPVAHHAQFSFGRRVAPSGRPGRAEIAAIEQEIADMERPRQPHVADARRLNALWGKLEELKRRRKAIPYIDPFDIRYNRFEHGAGAQHQRRHVLPDGRLRAPWASARRTWPSASSSCSTSS